MRLVQSAFQYCTRLEQACAAELMAVGDVVLSSTCLEFQKPDGSGFIVKSTGMVGKDVEMLYCLAFCPRPSIKTE